MDNTFTLKGLTFDYSVEPDDGHGLVRDVRSAELKRPGERVLHTGRGGHAWLYDWQEASRLAKRDGWGLGPDQLAALAKKLGRGPKPGEVRAAAVQQDYDYCRRYASGDWCWSYVRVRLLDVDMEPTGEAETLGGIESDDYAHHEQIARELAAGIAGRIPSRAKVYETRKGASVTRWRVRR